MEHNSTLARPNTSDSPRSYAGPAERLSVLLVSYRLGELLERCLQSLVRADLSGVDEVVLVVNGPGDATGLCERFATLPLRILQVADRRKCVALNVGVRAIAEGVVVFLDDDVRISETLFQAYRRAFEGEQRIFCGGATASNRGRYRFQIGVRQVDRQQSQAHQVRPDQAFSRLSQEPGPQCSGLSGSSCLYVGARYRVVAGHAATTAGSRLIDAWNASADHCAVALGHVLSAARLSGDRFMGLRSWTCALLVLTTAPALADESYRSYDGAAVDYDTGAPIYDESHYLRLVDGQLAERVVLYKCPQGAAFARKRMRTDGEELRPLFELEDARIGYREGLREAAGKLEVYFQAGAEAKEESEPLVIPEELVADAGFDAFVRKHWAELTADETVKFDFLVPSRLEYMSFKVKRLRSETEAGEAAEVFRLGLSGVLGWFLSGIDVWYASSDKALLRFDGLSNVRNPERENYKARIRFPRDQARADADRSAFDAALAVQLVRSCDTTAKAGA